MDASRCSLMTRVNKATITTSATLAPRMLEWTHWRKIYKLPLPTRDQPDPAAASRIWTLAAIKSSRAATDLLGSNTVLSISLSCTIKKGLKVLRATGIDLWSLTRDWQAVQPTDLAIVTDTMKLKLLRQQSPCLQLKRKASSSLFCATNTAILSMRHPGCRQIHLVTVLCSKKEARCAPFITDLSQEKRSGPH